MHEIKFKPCRCKARTDSASVGCSWYCRFQRWKYVYVWSPYVGDTTSFWKHSRLQASNVSHLPQALLLVLFLRAALLVTATSTDDWYWLFQWWRYVYTHVILKTLTSTSIYVACMDTFHRWRAILMSLALLHDAGLVTSSTATDTTDLAKWWSGFA